MHGRAARGVAGMGLPGVHLNVNAADRRALGFCRHLGFTGLRTGDRNTLGLKPR
jgi:hypothetical protein